MDIDAIGEKWVSRRLDFQKNHQQEFNRSYDLLAIVLRGHLIIESMIDDINHHCFDFPDFYDEAALPFSKKLLILQAQVKPFSDDYIWLYPSISMLNSLRNGFAHNLSYKNQMKKIDTFLQLVEPQYPDKISENMEPTSTNIEHRMKGAVTYILGTLEAMELYIEVIETTKREHLNKIK